MSPTLPRRLSRARPRFGYPPPMTRLWKSNLTVVLSALAIAAAAPACSKKDKDKGKNTKKKPPKDIKKKAKPLTDLVKKGPLALIGPAAKVTIGGDFAEEQKKAGSNKMFSRDGENFFDWGGDDKGGIRFTVHQDNKNKRVDYVEVEFARHTKVKETLVGAWGRPTVANHWTMKDSSGPTKVHYWFNADAGLRAHYYQQNDKIGGQKLLKFERYQPFTKLIGEGDKMAFATKPILGATEKEIQAAYKDYDPKFGISLTPVEWNPRFTQVFVRFDKQGKAKNYRIPLWTKFSDKAKASYLAALEKKFGKPTVEKGKDKQPDVMVFKKADPRIVAYEKNDQLSITVGAK